MNWNEEILKEFIHNYIKDNLRVEVEECDNFRDKFYEIHPRQNQRWRYKISVTLGEKLVHSSLLPDWDYTEDVW